MIISELAIEHLLRCSLVLSKNSGQIIHILRKRHIYYHVLFYSKSLGPKSTVKSALLMDCNVSRFTYNKHRMQ